jgi:hypothetical protein
MRRYVSASPAVCYTGRVARPADRLALVAALLCVVCVVPLAARADVVVGAQGRTAVALTIYSGQDLALVRETRTVDLDAGAGTLRFEDVAARLDPRTVTLQAADDPASLAVLEQSYLYDLSSPQALLARWVGRDVELVETDARLRTRVTQATLLSTESGNTYRIGDRIARGHPGWLMLPPTGDEVFTRPTLRWRLDNAGAAHRSLEVSYATGGLSWSADYVLVLAADGEHADLTAWATLTNDSGAGYDDAAIMLVAGEIHRAAPPAAPMVARMEAAAAPAAAPPPTPEAFAESYRYALERHASVAENETKQLPLLAAHGVGVTKRYELRGDAWWLRRPMPSPDRRVPVTVLLDLPNTAANHLGRDLPAGIVRVFQSDATGARQLAGEDALRQTAAEETAVLELSRAADVVATRRQTDWHKLAVEPFEAESAYEVTLRNQKSVPITVAVREQISGDWEVLESNLPARKDDAHTLVFDVPVAAGAETVLRYRVRVGR